MLYCDIVMSSNSSHYMTHSFELIHLGKAWTPLSINYVFSSTATVLQQGWLWHQIPTKVDVPFNRETKLKPLDRLFRCYFVSWTKLSVSSERFAVNDLYCTRLPLEKEVRYSNPALSVVIRLHLDKKRDLCKRWNHEENTTTENVKKKLQTKNLLRNYLVFRSKYILDISSWHVWFLL